MLDAQATLPDDADELKALVLAQRAEIVIRNAEITVREAEIRSRDVLIEKLKQQLAGMRRNRFGASAEALDQFELVLEGEVPPGLLEPEGPYGEVTGTYASAGESEVFQVKTITRRADPIFYALHCGAPVTDAQSTMGLGIEVATRNHLGDVEGGIDLLDVRAITASGDMMLILKLRPRQPGQAKTALLAAMAGPYLHPKLVIAVDEDIDAGDLRQIAWSMTTRVEASRDVTMIPDTRVFGLDSISPRVPGMGPFTRLGTKWLIDATLPVELDEAGRQEFDAAYPKNYDQVRLEDFLS